MRKRSAFPLQANRRQAKGEEWMQATDSDGLNLWHVITPGTYADFAEHGVPELQRRGV
jgi:hypothetical protein